MMDPCITMVLVARLHLTVGISHIFESYDQLVYPHQPLPIPDASSQVHPLLYTVLLLYPLPFVASFFKHLCNPPSSSFHITSFLVNLHCWLIQFIYWCLYCWLYCCQLTDTIKIKIDIDEDHCCFFSNLVWYITSGLASLSPTMILGYTVIGINIFDCCQACWNGPFFTIFVLDTDT